MEDSDVTAAATELSLSVPAITKTMTRENVTEPVTTALPTTPSAETRLPTDDPEPFTVSPNPVIWNVTHKGLGLGPF